MKSRQQSQLIGIDLFAGAGGMSLGASLSGIDVQFAVENDPWACRTYRRNHLRGYANLFVRGCLERELWTAKF